MEPAEAAARVGQLRRDCEAVIGECLEAVSSELSFFTLPNCFELFGFDLLVTRPLAQRMPMSWGSRVPEVQGVVPLRVNRGFGVSMSTGASH